MKTWKTPILKLMEKHELQKTFALNACSGYTACSLHDSCPLNLCYGFAR